MLPFTVHPVGDSALLAVFTQRIAPEIGAAVAALNTRVLSANISGVDETVPAFASLMVTYDPLVTDYDAVATAMQKLADVPDADSTAENGKLVTIPVCYGGEFGPARGSDRAGGHRPAHRAGLPHLYAGLSARLPVSGRAG